MTVVNKVKWHLLWEQNAKEIKEDISVINLNLSNLLKAVIPRTNPQKHSKIVHLYINLSKTALCITPLMQKIDVYKSPCPVYFSPRNIDMLSTERFFTLKKERFITTHSWWWSVGFSEVDFLWEFVDWARNKCTLSALADIRIKQLEFRENVWTFPRDNENRP